MVFAFDMKSSTDPTSSTNNVSPFMILSLVPIFIIFVWHLNAALFPPPPPPPMLQNSRIVLLTAHPDDESMFFAPTLLALTRPALGNHVKILCLSTGDADGLGDTRRKEIQNASLLLGLRKAEDVFVIDDVSRFRDGMKEQWDEKDIANLLEEAFIEGGSKGKSGGSSKKSVKSNATGGAKATIDVLITFDQHGVSSHPNHKALFHGARLFISQLVKANPGYASPITLYTLPSVSILRKYLFVLDVLPTYMSGIADAIRIGLQGSKGQAKRNKGISKGSKNDRVVFISGLTEYFKARNAMVRGHKSQMVWFRWGWISLGRYMVLNDLRREVVT